MDNYSPSTLRTQDISSRNRTELAEITGGCAPAYGGQFLRVRTRDRHPDRGRTFEDVTIDPTPELPFVSAAADALALAHVLSERATNAGGMIELSIAEVINNGETWVTFTVRDLEQDSAPDEQSPIFWIRQE